jgi:outer membrane protein TolC
MRFKSSTFILFYSFLSLQLAFAQQRDLQFYQSQAHASNPVLKENNNLQLFNNLQNDLSIAQFRKPQVNISADYLFAPFFNNNGHAISITTNPEKDAYGYDVSLSNGGLYATQLNVSVPLLTGGIAKAYDQQVLSQNQLLQNNNSQLLHDLDKNISDQYIAIYQLQEQESYQQKLIEMLQDRQQIVETLVLKGLMQQSDYLLLDIDKKQRQYEAQQLRINLAAGFNQLNNFCSISDTTIYELTEPVILQTQPTAQFNYKLKFELDSTSIIAKQKIFNTKYKPQLSAFGNTGLNAADAGNIPHNVGLSAGLHLVISLYDGGQKNTTAQQNKILLDNLLLHQDQNSLAVENNLASLQQQITLTQQSVTLINSQLASQETLLLILKDKVVTGQISVTDYLLTLQNYAASNQNKIISQTNLWLLINQYNYINW